MKKTGYLAITAIAAALLLPATPAFAHCDSLDGPVAKAAVEALDKGDVKPAFAYIPAASEAELSAAFTRSLKVRSMSPDARQLADLSFIETAVRLHRAGEGAAYTGLKPAGLDHGPAIPAAEQAIATGSLADVETLLNETMRHGLAARFAHATHAAPADAGDVAAARERASAELAFVTYVEGLRQAAEGGAGHKE